MANSTIDAFLSQPLWLITAVVFGIWGVVAVLAHRMLVPLIAGREGTKLGGFEAEVVALIGLAFGLLISFNAVTVWQTVDVARDAVIREVAALEDAAYEIDLLPAPEREPAREALLNYIGYVVTTEWPLLRTRPAVRRAERAPADRAARARATGRNDARGRRIGGGRRKRPYVPPPMRRIPLTLPCPSRERVVTAGTKPPVSLSERQRSYRRSSSD